MKKIVLLFLSIMIAFVALTTNTYAAAIYDHEVVLDMNGGDYVHQDIIELGSKLDQGIEPITMLALGDSTSNHTTDWYYKFGELLASDLSSYSVQYRPWDNTSAEFGDNVSIQYGDLGDAYALFEDQSGDYISTMDRTELSITGDIDLRAKVQGVASESGSVIAKWASTTKMSYQLFYAVDATGELAKITLMWSEDGSTLKSATSGFFTLPVDDEIWIQATLDVDDGVAGYIADFNYSEDGVTYTNIATTTTVAGATSIYDSDSAVEIGSIYNGGANLFDGKIFAVEIRDGIDGSIVASPDLDMAFPYSIPSFKDVEGNVWVVNGELSVGNGSPGLLLINGSIAGATVSTFTANTLMSLTQTDIDLVFINLGHNYDINDSYDVILDDFIDNIELYANEASIALITQNAQTDPRTAAQIAAQNIRMDQVKLIAARNDLILIDSGSVLDSDPVSYVGPDGVHPTAEAYDVWADTVYDMFSYRRGSGLSEITLLVEDGELIVQPNTPYKEGATFLGWYSNVSLTDKWNFDSDKVQDDMVLYAKWSDSSTVNVPIISISNSSLNFLGLAWYIWAIGIVIVYYLFFTNSGRKFLGLKPLKKGKRY